MLQPTITRYGPRLRATLAELPGLDGASLFPRDLRILDAISERCAQLRDDFEDGIAHARAEQRQEAHDVRTHRIAPPPGRVETMLPADARVRDAVGKV